MNRPVRLLLFSTCLALMAEVALLVNWRVLAVHDAVGGGVVSFTWMWPLAWTFLALLSLGCMGLERAAAGDVNSLRPGVTAAHMLLRLLVPILLLVCPAIVLMYALVMVLTAVGVTASTP